MIEIGRLAVKTAGRDAGGHAVVVDILDDNNVMIDGGVRRRKCNINHLVLLAQKIDISKKASHEDVEKEFRKLKLDVWSTKPKKTAERPRKKRKTSEELKAQKEEKKKLRESAKKKQGEKIEKVKPAVEQTLEEKAGLGETTEEVKDVVKEVKKEGKKDSPKKSVKKSVKKK